jgi:signal transduction histidine kinase/BarA-like signal transduction histidine kinase/ligand-binding sensor domain-containing protein
MIRTSLLLIAVVMAPASAVNGQGMSSEAGRPYYVQRYTPQEYGQNEQNWSIAQDERGLIFVANRSGVLEFDGREWRHHDIPNVFARSLDAARGEVCVGGYGEIGCFVSDSLGVLGYQSLSHEIPEQHRDFADVWTTHITNFGVVFQSFQRLFIWNGGRMTVYETSARYHKAFHVNERLIIREEGVGLVELRSDGIYSLGWGDQFADERIDALISDGYNGFVIATRNKGLMKWNGSDLVSFKTDIDYYIFSNRLYHGIRILNKYIVLTTTAGSVFIIDDYGVLVTVLDSNIGLENHEFVLDVILDEQGGLWLALDTSVFRVDLISPLTFLGQENGLEGTVYDVQRHMGVLHVATSLGLFKLRAVGEIENDRTAGPAFQRAMPLNQQVWGMRSTRDALLVAANDGVYELKNGRHRLVVPERAFSVALSDRDSTLAYVGLKSGLGLLRLADGGWTMEGMVEGLDIGQVLFADEGSDGRIWLSTLADGALSVRLEGLQIVEHRRYGVDDGLPEGVAQVFPYRGGLALQTVDGIYLIDEENDVFMRDSDFDLIMKDEVDGRYVVNYSRTGDVWTISDGKISIHRRENDSLVDVTPTALRLGGVPPRRLYLDSDGVAWIAIDQGLLRFDPRIEKDYDVPYRALVRSVVRRGQELIYGGSATHGFAIPEILHSQNSLRFVVSAATFNLPEATRYQTWLEGFDDGWSEWTADAYKEYTNLPEGRYRFHVRALNVHGVISETDTFAFVVLPPWYRTWWAYTLYVFLAAGLLWSYGRWRLRAHLKEMERERRVREDLEMANVRLREANERLHHADKLKDDLLANTSHELRTPLTAILGFASVLEEELVGEHSEFASRINRSGQRLLDSVNSLLDMARLQADTIDFEPTTFDLAATVNAICAPLRKEAAEKGLFLSIMPEDLQVHVALDRHSLQRIVSNLVGNAIKFTNTGGVCVFLDHDDENVFLTIQDTGIGIREEFLPHLFDQFQQESSGYSRSHEGSGLGLAITNRLVTLLGGEINVETRRGQGTSFTVRLPRSTSEEMRRATYMPSRLHGRRMLLVTDRKQDSADLTDALSRLTHLDVAYGKDEAAGFATRDAYDIVLVDVAIALWSDGRLIPVLRSNRSMQEAVFIGVAGGAGSEDRERVRQAGFFDVISRPYTRQRILLTLDAAIDPAIAV